MVFVEFAGMERSVLLLLGWVGRVFPWIWVQVAGVLRFVTVG